MSKMNKKMNKTNATSKTNAQANSNAQAQATSKTNSNGYNSCSINSNYNER